MMAALGFASIYSTRFLQQSRCLRISANMTSHNITGQAVTVYKFGHVWFEIQLAEWSELTVTEENFSAPEAGRRVDVLEYCRASRLPETPLPQSCPLHSKDCSVVFSYKLSRDEIQGSALRAVLSDCWTPQSAPCATSADLTILTIRDHPTPASNQACVKQMLSSCARLAAPR